MINGKLYMVYVGNSLADITNNKEKCEKEIKKYKKSNCNLSDKVWYGTINLNRWQQCDKAIRCVEDTYTGKSIQCSNKQEAQKAEKTLNEIDIEQQKNEAKIRALLL